MKKVLLCADSACLHYPQVMGLAGERLDSQEWLLVASSAQEARERMRAAPEVREAWVVSCEDMEPLNVAACLKRDDSSRRVYVLAAQATGSFASRVKAAGIDGALSHQALAARYAAAKRGEDAARSEGGGPAPRVSSTGEIWLPMRSSREEVPFAQDGAGCQVAPDDSSGRLAARVAVAEAAPERVPDTAAPAPQPVSASTVDFAACASASPGFLLTVASGSGGAGKSTVAALSALLSQARGHKTLLVDCDAQFGDMKEMMGCEHALALDEVAANPALLDRLEPDAGRPALLAAPARMERSEEALAALPRLLPALLERFEVVVANTGANWGEPHIALLERSSKVLMLVDQRASSLRACRHAFQLCARCGVAASPFVFVANRCSKTALFTSLDVSCAMQGARAVELADGGREVEELLGAGMALELVAARNDLCVTLNDLLGDILPDSGRAAEEAIAALSGEPRGFFWKWRSQRKGRGHDSDGSRSGSW